MREMRFRYRPTGGLVSLSWTPSGLLGVGGQRHGPPVFCGSRALTNVLRPRGHVPQPRGARPAGEGPRACHTLPSGGLASVPRVLSLRLTVLEDSPRGGTPHHTDTLGWLTCAHSPPAAGAVVLDVTCFAEAERLYMLVRDTAVHGRPLTALVLPEVLVSGHWGLGRAAASTAGSSNAQVSAAHAQVTQVGDLARGHWPGDLVDSRPALALCPWVTGPGWTPLPSRPRIPAWSLWPAGGAP